MDEESGQKLEFEGQRTGERVIFVFRRHIVTAGRGLLWLIVLTGLGFVPMILWPDNQMMVFLWMGMVGLGLLGLGYSYMLWYFSFYMITNERLRQTRQKGLFRKTVVDLDLANIQSVSYGVMGVFATMLNYGTILVQTVAGDLTLSVVGHPEEVYNKLQDAVHAAQREE